MATYLQAIPEITPQDFFLIDLLPGWAKDVFRAKRKKCLFIFIAGFLSGPGICGMSFRQNKTFFFASGIPPGHVALNDYNSSGPLLTLVGQCLVMY